MTQKEWGKRVRIACLEKEVTLKKVCEDVGVSRQYFYMIASGIRRGGVWAAAKISDYLDIPLYDEV